MNDKAPQVFLSYAHESDEFRQTVRELAEYLRGQGICVVTDHPYENRAPQNGWRAWMQHCVEDSDLVLVICTPRYRASFEKRDPDLASGFGRTWEAAIITQDLYETKLQNAKYIPVLPDGGAPDDVPVVLRDFSNGLRFPSQQERIFRAIAEEIQDPNANLSAFHRRPPGQLSADDNRLSADQRDVYGRDQEIAQVLEFLHGAEAAAQVVAHLTGTGGIGKTEICKRSLQLWLRQNPGARAYWVGLSDTASPAECAADIARALGHDNLPEIDQLFSLLRPGLYYIDNLESLDSPEGNHLLRRLGCTPGVRVLASSRVRLAALGKPIEVDTLPLEAALRTFREAWTGRDELFDSPDFPVFVERDLGCHALSVVLVAALGEAKSLNRIMADWRAKGTAIVRQENDPSRRGSLAVSLHLTSDAVAARHPGALLLWSVAALFPDGLDEGVLGWLYQAVPEVNDDALLLLTRHRVLIRRGERYHLLPPVARFALDEARREAGGFSWAATKAAVLPLLEDMVRRADSIASTDEALQARAVLLEKFPTVHRFLLEECRQEQPDTALLAFFQNGLRNWFQLNILLGKDILETMKPVLARAEDRQGYYAATLLALGELESHTGNMDAARLLFQDAIKIFKKVHNDLGRAYALRALGELEINTGNVQEARHLYDESIELFKKEKADLGCANALLAKGNLEMRLGKLKGACRLFDSAIKLFKKEKADLGCANAFFSKGILENRLGNTAEASRLLKDAIGLFKKEKTDLSCANALLELSHLECKLGNLKNARSLIDEAIRLYVKEQADLGHANALLLLGELECLMGSAQVAYPLYGKAIKLFKKVHNDLGCANALQALGDLERRLGNVERARSLYDEAIGLFKKEQDDLGRANALQALGDLDAESNPSGAADLYEQALRLYQKEQDPVGLINTCVSMARQTHQHGPQGSEQAPATVWHERALSVARQTGVAFYIEHVENAVRELFG